MNFYNHSWLYMVCARFLHNLLILLLYCTRPFLLGRPDSENFMCQPTQEKSIKIFELEGFPFFKSWPKEIYCKYLLTGCGTCIFQKGDWDPVSTTGGMAQWCVKKTMYIGKVYHPTGWKIKHSEAVATERARVTLNSAHHYIIVLWW